MILCYLKMYSSTGYEQMLFHLFILVDIAALYSQNINLLFIISMRPCISFDVLSKAQQVFLQKIFAFIKWAW